MGGVCRSCGARIIWTKTEKGKPMPVDAEPVDEGNIRVEQREQGLTAVYEAGPSLLEWEVVRYVSHFATCPQSGEWRRS